MDADNYGLIIQKDGDAGDSAMETCFDAICSYFMGYEFLSLMSYISVKTQCIQSHFPWRIRRHPDPEKWYREWVHGTGDQWQNYIITAGLHYDYIELIKHFISFSLRGFFCTNTRRRNVYPTYLEHKRKSPRWRKWKPGWILPDFRPGFFFLFIRGFYPFSIPLWPLLFISDFGLVFGAVMKSWFPDRKAKEGNDGNFFAKCIYSKNRMPTITAKLARWIYFNYRFDLRDGKKLNRIQAALERQYNDGKNPRLDLASFYLCRKDEFV